MGIFDFLFGKTTEPEAACPEFEFKAPQHQRYESGDAVLGLQNHPRTVRVTKNTDGCNGYKLQPGDGYIVRIWNDELSREQMAAKPMRVVSATKDKVELRGYPTVAMTPFGWDDYDLSGYGLTVYLSGGKVTKCVLHMFDRNVDLEYRQG